MGFLKEIKASAYVKRFSPVSNDERMTSSEDGWLSGQQVPWLANQRASYFLTVPQEPITTSDTFVLQTGKVKGGGNRDAISLPAHLVYKQRYSGNVTLRGDAAWTCAQGFRSTDYLKTKKSNNKLKRSGRLPSWVPRDKDECSATWFYRLSTKFWKFRSFTEANPFFFFLEKEEK